MPNIALPCQELCGCCRRNAGRPPYGMCVRCWQQLKKREKQRLESARRAGRREAVRNVLLQVVKRLGRLVTKLAESETTSSDKKIQVIDATIPEVALCGQLAELFAEIGQMDLPAPAGYIYYIQGETTGLPEKPLRGRLAIVPLDRVADIFRKPKADLIKAVEESGGMVAAVSLKTSQSHAVASLVMLKRGSAQAPSA